MPFDFVGKQLATINAPQYGDVWSIPSFKPYNAPIKDFASVDFETFGDRDLSLVGTHAYMESQWFAPLCMGWAINYEPVQLWREGDPFPKDLRRHIERGGMMHAWHAMFERLAWLHWRRKTKNIPEVRREQWRCTMVRSLACGFPGALQYAAPAMRVKEIKDAEGSKAMKKLVRPRNLRAIRKAIKLGETPPDPERWDRDEFADLYKKMYRYCKQDVVTERACGKVLPLLPPDEEAQYVYDQIVADRGIRIDTDLCHAAVRAVTKRQKQLAERSQKLCGYGPTQPVAVKEWVNKHSKLEIENLKKETVEAALKRKMPDNVRAVLTARLEGGRSSTSKYKAALVHICQDGTVKGARQFYGAHTSRWAGRGVQFDNLKRVDMKVDLDELVEIVATGSSQLIDFWYGNVLEPVSNATRSMLVADEGHELFVADFKSIESRLLAHTTGQTSTNDQWRLSDQGKGPDVYVKNAARQFGVPIDKVTKDQRYWGKIAELLLGYEGGTVPLLRGTEKSSVKFRDIHDTLRKAANARIRDKVNFLWKKMGKGNEKDWRAARYMVELWRADNPMTVKFWKQMRIQSINAVRFNKPTEYRGIKFRYDDKFKMLVITTLTGKNLYYPFAHVVQVYNKVKKTTDWELRAYYYESNPKVRKFIKYNPYGGLITENIIQHEARHAMAEKFEPLEKRSFKLLHTVHDELIAQAKKGLRKLSDFTDILQSPSQYFVSCPLAVEAWSGPRYKKSE